MQTNTQDNSKEGSPPTLSHLPSLQPRDILELTRDDGPPSSHSFGPDDKNNNDDQLQYVQEHNGMDAPEQRKLAQKDQNKAEGRPSYWKDETLLLPPTNATIFTPKQEKISYPNT
jgi:hypothetical protein